MGGGGALKADDDVFNTTGASRLSDDSSHLDHFSFYCCEVFTGAHRAIPSNTTTSPLVSWSETYRRTANWTTSVMSYVTRSAQGSFADGAAVLGARC